MPAVALDTAKYVDNLEAVKMSREQARAIVELVRSSHELADVATKGDIALLRKDIEAVQQGLQKDLNTVQMGLHKDMEALGNKLLIKLTLAMGGLIGIAVTIATLVLRTVLK